MTFVQDEIWDILAFDAFAKPNDFPICTNNRHERYRFPEVFGELEGFDSGLGTDIMLRCSRKFVVAYTFILDEQIIDWEIRENTWIDWM